MDQLTFWSEEHPAKHSALQDSAADYQTRAVTCRSHTANSQTRSTQNGLSGRTCRASLAAKTTPLAAFWQDFAERMNPSYAAEHGRVQAWYLGRNEPRHGAFSMLNTSEWPNDADVSLCSLSEVLETGPLQQHYFLSAKACTGILRRAAKRGKKLPEPLARALKAAASTALTKPVMDMCSQSSSLNGPPK